MDDAISLPTKSNVFLKMDIEGAEVGALQGASRLLQDNKIKASVCSYHNKDDCLKIKSIFQKYGYKTSTSDGYMVFLVDNTAWENNIWKTTDFRKGMVYASNY